MKNLKVWDSAHVLNWQSGLLTLAVERGHSLFERSGLPEAICRSPDQVTERARRFQLALRGIPMGSKDDPRYLQAVEAQLRQTFRQLEMAYGPEVTDDLRRWLLRHFVCHSERDQWFHWRLVLPRLAGAFGHEPKVMSPMSPAALERFTAIVRSQFNPEQTKDDEETAIRARIRSLSALERDLVALHGPQPDDVDQWDVVTLLLEAADAERARRAWKQIHESFNPDEREALVKWAREEAAQTNWIRPERIVEPSPEK